jgi:16S rRNA pseudouridine516 synthase
MMRLDKLLAHSGYGTRKEVKEIIRKGFVLVNGDVIKSDDYKVSEENDEIIVAGNQVNYEKMIYIMLNKPDGYISATYDNYDPIVLDLIDGYENRGLFPVGRLDKDSEGLLLITNDGLLAHRLLAPKYHVDKKYYIKYDGVVNDDKIKKLENGITIDDGYKCKEARFIAISPNEAYIVISEGKFHQVKRMMEAIDCNVTYLKRVEFGPLELDDSLEPGEYRHLTEEEVSLLKAE